MMKGLKRGVSGVLSALGGLLVDGSHVLALMKEIKTAQGF